MNQTLPNIGLGDRVKDPISGTAGIVTCITHWLHGCIRIGVQPEITHEGRPVEAIYFDQTQLVLLEAKVHEPMMLVVAPAPPAPERKSPGGPSRESARFAR